MSEADLDKNVLQQRCNVPISQSLKNRKAFRYAKNGEGI